MKYAASKLALALAAVSLTGTVVHAQESERHEGKIKHVLLLSIDGMHAVDFKNCAEGLPSVEGGDPYCPNIAALSQTGVNYVAASTSKPSDSFPGLMSIVSGASPRTMGVYYDVAYDRSLSAPALTTGNGVAAGPCSPYGAPTGTTTEYEEGIDIDQTKLNGGAPGASVTDGTVASIEPKRLPRNPANGCAPVYPWEFVRTNTIFGVIHNAGGYTAWSDKHPAYSSVKGQGGTLDDFYAPEINSNVIPLPGTRTPLGENCATILDPGSDLTAWTNSFQNIRCYDQLKVRAILKEIDGKDHLGLRGTKVPTIFGMNFQAVSVAQKLIEKSNGVTGGYLDAQGTPTPALLKEIQFVDASIAAMVTELKDRGLYDSTLIIVTAKHGQSPIDPKRYVAELKTGTSPATLLSSAGLLPFSESTLNPNGIGPTEDDISQIWLNSPNETAQAVGILEDNLNQAGISQIFYGNALALNYNAPGLGDGLDPRTPDIIVQPNVGVTYSGSTKKQAEHGGFAHDDTNVILLVSNPKIEKKTVHAAVETMQVAPTILEELGLDPKELDGVRKEGTAVLPDISFGKY
jgi:hypothetical protein